MFAGLGGDSVLGGEAGVGCRDQVMQGAGRCAMSWGFIPWRVYGG